MTRRVARREGVDHPLAATFRCNAASFLEGAEAALPRYPEATRYFLAIAIELALKAYLLDRGISDDWNRVYLRHDLAKTLRFARRAGFNGASAGVAELAALLGPYYQVHGISRMTPDEVASVCWRQACTTVRELIAAVTETAGLASFVEGNVA